MTGHENKEVRSANRKFFARIIPLLMLMLIINQIDRSNVGFIKHALELDVGISSAAFGFGAGLFLSAMRCLKCRAISCSIVLGPAPG